MSRPNNMPLHASWCWLLQIQSLLSIRWDYSYILCMLRQFACQQNWLDLELLSLQTSSSRCLLGVVFLFFFPWNCVGDDLIFFQGDVMHPLNQFSAKPAELNMTGSENCKHQAPLMCFLDGGMKTFQPAASFLLYRKFTHVFEDELWCFEVSGLNGSGWRMTVIFPSQKPSLTYFSCYKLL